MNNKKETTIYDIARHLNLSTATVSRALNGQSTVRKQTKKKIMETAKELGYRSNVFASNLRTKHTHTLGIIIPKLNSNFMSSVLAGIEKIANTSGYNLIITQSQENENKEITNANTLFRNRVDGLIVSLAFNTQDFSHFNQFFEKEIPVIFFDRINKENPNTNVIIDNFKAGYDATTHLLEQGCKKIIHITGNLSRNVYQDRFEGYKKALQEHEVDYNKNLLMVNDLKETTAIKSAEKIIRMKPRPDGLFIANDRFAAICMQHLKKADIHIPKEIAVVGFNNDLISRIIEPNLTTINYPGQKMGETIAQNLINHLNGTSSLTNTHTLIIKSNLIIRDSSFKKNN